MYSKVKMSLAGDVNCQNVYQKCMKAIMKASKLRGFTNLLFWISSNHNFNFSRNFNIISARMIWCHKTKFHKYFRENSCAEYEMLKHWSNCWKLHLVLPSRSSCESTTWRHFLSFFRHISDCFVYFFSFRFSILAFHFSSFVVGRKFLYKNICE